ncbi:MAG TPA: hypothetical protein VGC56_10890 [Allosphingosinicella sp.]
MKTLAWLMIPIAALASSATAQKVETGSTEWDKLAPARMGSDDLDYNRLVRWATQELQNPACRVNGMRPDKFDIDEPYAVLLEPNGNVSRIIVREMGCPGLNTIVGSTVAEMAKRGKFHPTGEKTPLWYGGRLSFAAANSTPH